MIIFRDPNHVTKPKDGICFAFLPKRVPEGWVWLEHLHRTFDEAENYGMGGYKYRRFLPSKLYSEGLRAQAEFSEKSAAFHRVWHSARPQ